MDILYLLCHENKIIASCYRTLPLVFKSKYDENLTLIGAYLNSPEEYSANDGNYLLIVNNFSLMERYYDNLVLTIGTLKILFDKDFKMSIFEFYSAQHQEYPTKDLSSTGK